MTPTATEFFHLDQQMRFAPSDMPDDAYGELVSKNGPNAAFRFVTTKPIAAP